MSFLTPFYLLAGLAIGAPILFHLIRKIPKGRQLFSSLMFLTPSPPRFSKQKRIENWLLLLLRSAALILLAVAFARPFWKTDSLADWKRPSEQVLILLDRSASMQRPGYWSRAVIAARKIIDSAASDDVLQVMLFDETSAPVMTFAEWSSLPAGARKKELLQRIEERQPGWQGTSGGEQLFHATTLFPRQETKETVSQRIVLISDLQAGGNWDSLQAETWPDQVRLQIEDVSQSGESNFSVQPASDPRQSLQQFRFRLSSTPDASQNSVTWTWTEVSDKTDVSANSPKTNHPVLTEDVSLPPGESDIVLIPRETAEAAPAVLEVHGDSVAFDNRCYFVPTPAEDVTIVYRGPAEETGSLNGLRFFLGPLFPDDSSRRVQIVDWKAEEDIPSVPEGTLHWIIIGGDLSRPQRDWLKGWLRNGRQALFVARNAAQAALIGDLLDIEGIPIREETVPGHLLLGKVDLDHAALQQFRGPRFSDFTKLRIWKYRSMNLASVPSARVLAALENDAPMLFEIPVGKGMLTGLASGWNRDDSDLAVWSKFVPLMNGLLQQARPKTGLSRQWIVGQRLPFSSLKFHSEKVFVRHAEKTSTHSPDGEFVFDAPGFYQFAPTEEALGASSPDESGIMMAVNLAVGESRTERYPQELLEAGIPLQKGKDSPVDPEQRQRHFRQQQLQEMEARQQWWRWLLLGVLLLVGTESALAHWKGEQRQAAPG